MPHYAGDPIICFLTANLAPAVSGTAQEKNTPLFAPSSSGWEGRSISMKNCIVGSVLEPVEDNDRWTACL